MKRLLIVLTGLLLPAKAFAVSITDYGWSCDGFLKCGSSQDAVTDITINIINTVFNTITVLAIIAFLYGGVRMIVSRGEEGKEVGKKAMMYAAIGLILAILTYNGNRILRFVLEIIGTIGCGGSDGSIFC